MKLARHVTLMERRGKHMILRGKPEGKTSLSAPRYKWEDKIKMDLIGIG
jgi:hypothetical protein